MPRPKRHNSIIRWNLISPSLTTIRSHSCNDRPDALVMRSEASFGCYLHVFNHHTFFFVCLDAFASTKCDFISLANYCLLFHGLEFLFEKGNSRFWDTCCASNCANAKPFLVEQFNGLASLLCNFNASSRSAFRFLSLSSHGYGHDEGFSGKETIIEKCSKDLMLAKS